MDKNLYPVDSIRPDPGQPRKNKPPEYLKELAKSIAYKGLDNDGHIRKDPVGEWLVVNGECRWTAISLYLPGVLQEMARKGVEPCMKGWFRDEHGQMFMSCKIKEYEGENVDADVFLDQIRDNEVRKNLGRMETLQAFKRATDDFNIPLQEMADALGKTVATLEGDLPILGLPKAITNAYDAGFVTKAVARRLAQLPDDESLRLKAFTRAKKETDAKAAIARIDAYEKARNGKLGNKSLFGDWQAENPKWRVDARRAFGLLAKAVGKFDETPYSNGKMKQIVKAKKGELVEIELVAKAMQKQAMNMLAQITTERAEIGKTA